MVQALPILQGALSLFVGKWINFPQYMDAVVQLLWWAF